MSDIMRSVFVLQHVHEFKNGNEDVKFVGVYSSRKEAEKAIAKLICISGFKDTPNGFSIDEYELNQTQWLDGYKTV